MDEKTPKFLMGLVNLAAVLGAGLLVSTMLTAFSGYSAYARQKTRSSGCSVCSQVVKAK